MRSPLPVCTAWRGESTCLACDGRENTLFAHLPPDALAGLHVEVENVALAPGDVLHPAGGKAEHLWLLRAGAAKLLSMSWEGVPRIVRVLKPGEIVGLEGLLGSSYAHQAVAVGQVRACRVPLASVQKLCLEHATFQWAIMKQSHQAFLDTERWLVDMTSSAATARQRMARLLLHLRDGQSNRIYRFTREDLGFMLGVSLETASRIIASFLRERLLVRREPAARFYDGDIIRLELLAQSC